MVTGLSANQKGLYPVALSFNICPCVSTWKQTPSLMALCYKGKDLISLWLQFMGNAEANQAEQNKARTASPFKSTNCSHKLKGCCLLSVWCVCGRSFSVLRLLRPAKALLKAFIMHWAQPKMEQEINQLWENMSGTFCYTTYWACLLFLPTPSSWIENSTRLKTHLVIIFFINRRKWFFW